MKETKKAVLPKGVTIIPGIVDHSKDPVMLKKLAQMKSRLERAGLPKNWMAKAVK